MIQSCLNVLRRSRRRLRGQQLGYSPVQSGFMLTHRAVMNVGSGTPTEMRGALRLSERERRSRNAFKLSVHWLVSDCRVNTDDS